MQPSYYIIFIVLFVIIILQRKQKQTIIKNIINKKKSEDKTKMIELAKRFIEKGCIIYSFDGHQFTGVIKEVNDGAILIENGGSSEAINLDFVIRIREYPKNKNGKKKSVIID